MYEQEWEKSQKYMNWEGRTSSIELALKLGI